MSFVSAAALSLGPVLVAILAAALILPRSWLAFYAAFVMGAVGLSVAAKGPGALCFTGFSERR